MDSSETRKGPTEILPNTEMPGKTPNDVQKPSEVSHRIEPDTSLCIVALGTTLTNRKELLGALCKYVMSIDCAESLQKEWIRSMKPYPISLSLRNLQDILDVNKSMDKGCFNMAVRMLTCNSLLLFLDDTIHYMDLQFWVIS
uniref:Uncharacterized protein n=1 Tax=Oryza glumipatula TaxID=40148 RepID=A0A0E0ATL2_9ORYZ